LEVNQPEREADRSPQSNTGVQNAWRLTFTSPISSHGVVFKETVCFNVLYETMLSVIQTRTLQHRMIS
jgi:hypothetical protein